MPSHTESVRGVVSEKRMQVQRAGLATGEASLSYPNVCINQTGHFTVEVIMVCFLNSLGAGFPSVKDLVGRVKDTVHMGQSNK